MIFMKGVSIMKLAFLSLIGQGLLSLFILPILLTILIIFRRTPKSRRINAQIVVYSTLSFAFAFHIFNLFAGEYVESLNLILGDAIFLLILFGYIMQRLNVIIRQQIVLYSSISAMIFVDLLANNLIVSAALSLILLAGTWFYYSYLDPSNLKVKYAIGVYSVFKVILLINSFSEGVEFLAICSLIFCIISYTLLLTLFVNQLIGILEGTYETSIKDPLTGLYNRRYFTKCVEQCVERELPSSAIFIDIDNFKILNDTKGHAKGDEVLQKVANILSEQIEDLGVAGRYGGEEFVALIVEPSVDMQDLAESIRKRIKTEASLLLTEGDYSITASIGYSVYQDGWTYSNFIKKADEAMYTAKRAGKDKVVEYGSKEFLEFEESFKRFEIEGEEEGLDDKITVNSV